MQPQQDRDFTRQEGLYLKFSDAGLPINQNTPVIIERVNGDCSVSEFIIARDEAERLAGQLKEFLRQAAAPKPAPPADEPMPTFGTTATSMTISSGMARDLDERATPAPGADKPATLNLEQCAKLAVRIQQIGAEHPYRLEHNGPNIGKWVCQCGEVLGDQPIDEADGVAGRHIQNVVANLLREALAAASPAPHDKPTPCERCHGEVETVWVPTGFSGESEPLCGKCVSVMLGEAHELLEQAGVKLRDQHASAGRVRQLVAKWRKEVKECCPVSSKRSNFSCASCKRQLVDADELERALPPSTGEKVSGATSPAKDGEAH